MHEEYRLLLFLLKETFKRTNLQIDPLSISAPFLLTVSVKCEILRIYPTGKRLRAKLFRKMVSFVQHL